MLPSSDAHLSACVPALRSHREALAREVLRGADAPRLNRFAEPDGVLAQRVEEGLDLLTRFLEGDRAAGDLFIGTRLFELDDPSLSREENLTRRAVVVEDERKVLQGFVTREVSVEAGARFAAAHRALTAPLTTRQDKHVRTLFIGDCLMMEILSFLVGPLAEAGISVDPFPINEWSVDELRRVLSRFANTRYDMVFFSPFSHTRVPELDALLRPELSLRSARALDALVDGIIEATRVQLDFLAQTFECPIYVHDASLLPRGGNMAKVMGRALLTLRARARARARLNAWLSPYIAERNARTHRHLFLLGETGAMTPLARAKLGRYLHASQFQHATALSHRLAGEHLVRIKSMARLGGKKLVICDLDNTLWDGVIGEGAVRHFDDRQTILQRLKKDCGVVLSIASKNEPSNVRFGGSVLQMGDFVAPQISWGPKTEAIHTIKKQLNLQVKHMVFLDDRPDERALAQAEHPELTVLDPTDPETWAMMAHWAEVTHGSSDVDRTQMYQEQVARDAFTEEQGRHDRTAALKGLGLVITLREAGSGDLKRVAELINRTNQWNMAGSRTTLEQVKAWHASKDAFIVIGSSADRFGDMGATCVAVVTHGGGTAEIAAFVLSCRVFGHGVETAALDAIARRVFARAGASTLVGRYVATNQNGPGKNMYADHGFALVDGKFVQEKSAPRRDVPWARVEDRL